MTAIEFKFPGGRFHATPWGHHVNEGVPEWPPSPWRIHRALVATWKRKANNLAETDVREVLEKIAAPPIFFLPPATFFHTRHYMPWYKKGPMDRTLAFDTFVVVSPEESLVAHWERATLNEKQSRVLSEILSALTTLGRSEAWCDARLLTNSEQPPAHDLPRAFPLNGIRSDPDSETIPLLCPDKATMFTNDHTPKHTTTEGRGKAKKEMVTPLYDPDWHLCIETLDMHKKRRLLPPGSTWVDYARPRSAFTVQPPGCSNSLRPAEETMWRARSRGPAHTEASASGHTTPKAEDLVSPQKPEPQRQRPSKPRFQVARFALDSAVLPLVTDTLRVGENARIDLMGVFGRITQRNGIKGKSPIFSGKDADGNPIKGHRHAYYLPTSENDDNRGHLDHLTIYTAEGFGKDELRALDKLSQIQRRDRKDSGHPLEVVLLGLGTADEYHPGPLGKSSTWISVTPFVSPRHPKTRGKHKEPDEHLSHPALFLEAQLHQEIGRWLELTGQNPDQDKVQIYTVVDENGTFRAPDKNQKATGPRPIQFKRFRQKKGDDGGRRPAGFFKIEFPKPVSGPLALGHSCHFGLGLFVPLSETCE